MYDSGVIFHSDRKYDSILQSGVTTVGGYGTLTQLTSGISGTPSFLVAFSDAAGIIRAVGVESAGIAFINNGNLWYSSSGAGTVYWRVYGD